MTAKEVAKLIYSLGIPDVWVYESVIVIGRIGSSGENPSAHVLIHVADGRAWTTEHRIFEDLFDVQEWVIENYDTLVQL